MAMNLFDTYQYHMFKYKIVMRKTRAEHASRAGIDGLPSILLFVIYTLITSAIVGSTPLFVDLS
jgi:hypothetical protein